MSNYPAKDMPQKSRFSADEWRIVGGLTQAISENDRIEAAEILARHPAAGSERVLLKMLIDPAALVRASAAEALSFGRSEEVLDALFKASADRSRLARGYAVLSLADVQKTSAKAPAQRLTACARDMKKSAARGSDRRMGMRSSPSAKKRGSCS